MTSRFELWNNLHRAMMPLAHWYALIDNQVILKLQNKVIHEVLYNRYCLIKWAPMHEQVTLLRKLLSHIFEHYADVQDDSYISDEDIEDCPETFMPRPRIMPTGIHEPAIPQQPDTPHHSPRCNTKQRLEQNLHHIRRVLFPSETILEDEPMPLDDNNLEDKMCISQMTLQIGLMNHHQTGTCAFMMNTRMDVNILDHHPIQFP